jgi:hypothetical protein
MELGYEVRVGVAYGVYFPGKVEGGSGVRGDVYAEAEVGEGLEGGEELGIRGSEEMGRQRLAFSVEGAERSGMG